MNNKGYQKGFTLMELMIVVAIVAILVALAIPNYTRWVRKANRGEAQQLMMQYANNQELWRANAPTYANGASALGKPAHARYTFFVRATSNNPPTAGECQDVNPTATEYAIIACASGDQANDTERGDSCQYLSLNQTNVRGPANCW